MTRYNKVRYRRTEKPRISITLSGNVFLRYRDDEAIAQAQKGDLMVYPYHEVLNTTRQGDYGATGFSGYFKVDVYDGHDWRLVLLENIFPSREHHFSKRDRPIDVYALVESILLGLAGRSLIRTYREHYAVEEAAGEED